MKEQQTQVKEHEEQVKQMEDELSKLKAEHKSLLIEKSQLAENLTALVSYKCLVPVLMYSIIKWITYPKFCVYM